MTEPERHPDFAPGDIEQAVAAIPRFAREVFLLHVSDGLSYAEIASRLGISETRVVRSMTKTLTAMRHALHRIERRRR